MMSRSLLTAALGLGSVASKCPYDDGGAVVGGSWSLRVAGGLVMHSRAYITHKPRSSHCSIPVRTLAVSQQTVHRRQRRLGTHVDPIYPLELQLQLQTPQQWGAY